MRRNEAANAHKRRSGPAQWELAARLLAQDLLTDEQIAAQIGICRRTLARWKMRPDIAAHKKQIESVYLSVMARQTSITYLECLLR